MISAPGSVVFRHYYEVSVLSCESLTFSTNAEGHFAIHINVRDIRASRIPIYTSLETLRLFFSRMISPFFCPPPGPHHLIGWLSLKAQSQSLIEMSESGRELGGGRAVDPPLIVGEPIATPPLLI